MNKKFFSVLTFAKPECDNVLQPRPRVVRTETHFHTSAWQTLIDWKESFKNPLNVHVDVL